MLCSATGHLQHDLLRTGATVHRWVLAQFAQFLDIDPTIGGRIEMKVFRHLGEEQFHLR